MPELQTHDEFFEKLLATMREPVGPPCCELADRALHHHWGRPA